MAVNGSGKAHDHLVNDGRKSLLDNLSTRPDAVIFFLIDKIFYCPLAQAEVMFTE